MNYMNPVNLYSIVKASKGLTIALRDELYKSWGIKPKTDELASLETFVNQLSMVDANNPQRMVLNLGGCYFGFVIPQISKEFDCIWIGEKNIVNVELKSQPIDLIKIQKQLTRNKYYLRHLNRTVSSFTYVASDGNCYSLDESDCLNSCDFNDIARVIYTIHKERLFDGDISALFPPEQYLVSPFNSTNEFLEEHYFLTNHQQEIKADILNFVNDNSRGSFYAIYGGPGTGKSLLIYDIARTLMDFGEKVIIGHAGSLNNGHAMLNDNGWDIRPTKNVIDINISSVGKRNVFDYNLRDLADVYFMDESQRCYNLQQIAEEIAKQGKKCVFSIDPDQIMRYDEGCFNNSTKVNAFAGSNIKRLTSSIRTNPIILDFIKALFDQNKIANSEIKGHIEVTYCHTSDEVKITQEVLRERGYKVPVFTPRRISKDDYEDWFLPFGDSAHAVIGQEFDKVAALISPNVHYNDKGKLVSEKRYYYSEEKMLYQILTRARNKIHLIIFNNTTMLDRCLKLINHK